VPICLKSAVKTIVKQLIHIALTRVSYSILAWEEVVWGSNWPGGRERSPVRGAVGEQMFRGYLSGHPVFLGSVIELEHVRAVCRIKKWNLCCMWQYLNWWFDWMRVHLKMWSLHRYVIMVTDVMCMFLYWNEKIIRDLILFINYFFDICMLRM